MKNPPFGLFIERTSRSAYYIVPGKQAAKDQRNGVDPDGWTWYMLAGMTLPAASHHPTTKSAYEVADVFQRYFADYLRLHHCTSAEFKAINAILKCRTAALGGHMHECDACGERQIAYNGCKNRHCPKCGHFEKACWIEKQGELALDVPHYHVVFTTDHLINDLAYVNPQQVYALLMRTAGQLLKAYGRHYLGGDIGVTMVLHTWGQTLQPHIHVHCMVSAGALAPAEGEYEWRESKGTFLFPVVKLSRDFRDAFCDGLLRLFHQDELRLVGQSAKVDVEATVVQMRAKAWEVYIQKPIADRERLLDYLGKYMFRVAISNHRILEIADGKVSFTYVDNRGRDEGERSKHKTMTLDAVEFMRRFLRHILPDGFVRIRHYGLYASGMRAKLQIARQLLGQTAMDGDRLALTAQEWLASLVDNPLQCPFCGLGTMHSVGVIPRLFASTSDQEAMRSPI